MIPESAAVGIPIITGVMQAIKPFVKDARFLPPITIGMGVLFGLLHHTATQGPPPTWQAGLDGLIIGLASGGLWAAFRPYVPATKERPVKPRRRPVKAKKD